MTIGIDARLLTYRRGIGNFVYNLVTELGREPGAAPYTLYVDDPRAAAAVPARHLRTRVLRPPIYPVWEQCALPWAVAREEMRVLHCPANTGPLWLGAGTRLVLTIHDVMYLLPSSLLPPSPSLYQRLGRLYRRRVVPRVARRAAIVTTDSEYSRQDILRYLRLPPDRVRVVHLAPAPAFRRLPDGAATEELGRRLALDGRLIVALGAVDPRKNTRRVIEGFAHFRRTTDVDFRLVIVGLAPREQTPIREYSEQCGVAEHVTLLGFVPEDDLVTLYNIAEAVVYPSLYEGFGLPVLEAMACGAPVISANTTAIPEIAGRAALLIDPTSSEALGVALQQVTADPGLRRELTARGFAQAAQFSWGRTAAEMRSVYEQALQP